LTPASGVGSSGAVSVGLIAVIVLLAYLLGSIPFGLIVAKSQGVDIRAVGSGNIGATNVWRVMGKKWGLITFFADALKGVVAVKLGMALAAHWAIRVALPHGHERVEFFDPGYAGIAAAVSCIIGHNFPIWLKFKGGKGVATSLGVIFGMMPLPALLVFAIWALVFKTSRYVSLASLIAAVCLPLVVIAFLFLDGLRSWAHFYFAVAAAIMVVYRHQPNIARLVAGTELRVGEKKRETEESTKDTK
jgi:glycerol-3-phosphate acyltransferase PlsY